MHSYSKVAHQIEIEDGIFTEDAVREGLRIEEILHRAHEIHRSKGGLIGYDLEDWLQAEREWIGDINHVSGSEKRIKSLVVGDSHSWFQPTGDERTIVKRRTPPPIEPGFIDERRCKTALNFLGGACYVCVLGSSGVHGKSPVPFKWQMPVGWHLRFDDYLGKHASV